MEQPKTLKYGLYKCQFSYGNSVLNVSSLLEINIMAVLTSVQRIEICKSRLISIP